jgi:hypothetical protein
MSRLDKKKKIIYFFCNGVKETKKDFFENTGCSDNRGYIIFSIFAVGRF